MPQVELQAIENYACRRASLTIEAGELLVLLGPNGAGKTTLLNVIAGLVPYEGRVLFDGAPVDAIAARQRNVGYVFQDLVLFPHLDVVSNVAFGLRASGWPPARADARVRELLELLAIDHLAARFPARLSGGERQRVALARALAAHPAVLLLDEPFSSLDPQTSRFLQAELKQLQQDLGTTTVFVTHDLAEAEAVADRIAVVHGGVVAQVGPPDEVLCAPLAGDVADYLGAPNVLACRATRSLGHGLVEADCDGLVVVVLPDNGQAIGRITILPRDVVLCRRRPAAGLNVFEATLQQITPVAGAVRARVEAGGRELVAELPTTAAEGLEPGARVFVELNLMKIRTATG